MSELTILVAEDDDDDFFFTERMLKRCGPARLVRVESGREAIDYLQGSGAYADRLAFPTPDLLLLDLKMDDVDGYAVLAWLCENSARKSLKTFVLTGSGEQRDRDRVQATGAVAGYFVKPLSRENIAAMLNKN